MRTHPDDRPPPGALGPTGTGIDGPAAGEVDGRCERSVESTGLDWAVAATSAWLVLGLWLDARAHHELRDLESFFTPWHGVLYGGLLATLAVLLVVLLRGRAAGRPWRRALPLGYGLSLVGGLVFAAGGVADLAWHSVFGIEADIEALLSLPHLVLAAGGGLLVGGPLRAGWHRGGDAPWPALLSLAATLSVLTFFTEYANPFAIAWAAPDPTEAAGLAADGRGLRADAASDVGRALGVAGIILQAGILTGGLLLAVRRWDLRPGAATVLLGVTVGLGVVPHDEYRFVPAALVGGLLADVLLLRLRPSPGRRAALRAFSAAVPAVLFGLYFLTLRLTGGIGWTPPLWTGAVVLAGVVGLLLSYVLAPPPAVAHGGGPA